MVPNLEEKRAERASPRKFFLRKNFLELSKLLKFGNFPENFQTVKFVMGLMRIFQSGNFP